MRSLPSCHLCVLLTVLGVGCAAGCVGEGGGGPTPDGSSGGTSSGGSSSGGASSGGASSGGGSSGSGAQDPVFGPLVELGSLSQGGTPGAFITSGNKVFFIATARLWVTDGTVAGTRPVKDTTATSLTALPNGRVLYAERAGATSATWASDGTEAGTIQLLDKAFADVVAAEGRTFFTVQRNTGDTFSGTLVTRKDLHVTDGTVAGTRLLKASITAKEMHLFGFGANLVFLATHQEDPNNASSPYTEELWFSDGTEQNTVRFSQASNVYAFIGGRYGAAHGGRFYLPVEATDRKEYLWETDGTAAGTHRVQGVDDDNPQAFQVVGNTLLVLTSEKLWALGAGGEVRLVKEILAAPSPPIWGTDGTRIYFKARQGAGSFQMWASDGTAEGTVGLGSVVPTNPSTEEWAPMATTHGFLFTGSMPMENATLWATSGTAAGTTPLLPATTYARRASRGGAVLAGKAYLAVETSQNAFELMETDGTAAGTRVLTPAGVSQTNPLGGDPMGFNSITLPLGLPHVFGNMLLFGARDASGKVSLHRLVPSQLGTAQSSSSSGRSSSSAGASTGGSTNPCILAEWTRQTSCNLTQTWSFSPDGRGYFSDPDCNGVCDPLTFRFNFTCSDTHCDVAYTSSDTIACGDLGMQTPPTPSSDAFNYTCTSSTLTITSSTGTVTFGRL